MFIALSKARSRNVLEDALQIRLDEMNADKSFLLNGLSVAIEDYRKQFNSDSTSEEALKNANWEVTEYQNLIQQAQSDEKRARKKPYALPVRYTPYRTLKDQYIRDFSREIKLKLKENGLKLMGRYISQAQKQNYS